LNALIDPEFGQRDAENLVGSGWVRSHDDLGHLITAEVGEQHERIEYLDQAAEAGVAGQAVEPRRVVLLARWFESAERPKVAVKTDPRGNRRDTGRTDPIRHAGAERRAGRAPLRRDGAAGHSRAPS
jgi:hypothetical protein